MEKDYTCIRKIFNSMFFVEDFIYMSDNIACGQNYFKEYEGMEVKVYFEQQNNNYVLKIRLKKTKLIQCS